MHKAEPHKVIFIAVEDGKGAKKTAGSSWMVKDVVSARARRKTSLTLFSIQSLGWCARGWLVVWGQEIGIAVSSLGGKQAGMG